MARLPRSNAVALTLLAALAASAHAQTLTNIPTLTTGTTTGTAGSGNTDATSTGASTATGKAATNTKTAASTKTTATSGTTATTGASTSSVATTGTNSVTDAPSLSTGSTGTPFHLSNAPTIAGVGVPTIAVPYTANAPYMQKSSLPEGTVFIAIGAILAFLGACVLLWRGLVAWSINHSVKKAALASLRGGSALGEKGSPRHWNNRTPSYYPATTATSGSTAVNSRNGGAMLYKDEYGSSSMSLEPLTSSGKKQPHVRESVIEQSHRSSSVPPANLFFSPTAQAQQQSSNRDSTASAALVSPMSPNRGSSYMPAGYYAAPSSVLAGGAGNASLGSPGVPPSGLRHSTIYPSQGGEPAVSPPESPAYFNNSNGRAASRDGRRPPGYSSGVPAGAAGRNLGVLYAQPSSSSLAVHGAASSELLGSANGGGGSSRAPSAYLEDLFDNHGSGPRERF